MALVQTANAQCALVRKLPEPMEDTNRWGHDDQAKLSNQASRWRTRVTQLAWKPFPVV